ncbi:cupin domain-containing protein [Dietzia sp. NPDC055340]
MTTEDAAPAPGTADSVAAPRDPGREDREHGRRAGTDEGTATHHTDVIGRADPAAERPGASIVHQDETTKIVAFEFGEGQELPDHAAFHPVLIQILRGRVDFGLPDRTIRLQPGEILHLTPKLRHRVRALEPTTLTVTMLLPRE